MSIRGDQGAIMPTAHCVSTRTGIIRSVDAAFCDMVRRPGSDLVGRSYRVITVADDIAKSQRMLEGLVDRAVPTKLRKRYHRPDGSVVEADLLVSRFDDAGHLVSTLFWQEPSPLAPSPLRMWRAAVQVRHLYSCRMAELGPDLFGDHVGAILIQIYLAEAEGRSLTIEDIAVAMAMNPGTVVRWLKALRQHGLAQSDAERPDAVQLTHDGLVKVERLLTATLTPAAL
jgi:PAS domain S-box-containing protein